MSSSTTSGENRLTYSIQAPTEFEAICQYLIDLLAFHFNINLERVEIAEADVSIGNTPNCTWQLSKAFFALLEQREFHHKKWFESEPLLYHEGAPDYLGTCFYMVNSLQEYDTSQRDRFGRFPFTESYQYRFSCTDEDLVSDYLAQAVAGTPIDQKKSEGRHPSSIFLSHDIDRVNSWVWEEVKGVVKRKKPFAVTYILKHLLSGRSPWKNFPQIAALHKAEGFTSSFFWLCESGAGEDGIDNADYQIEKLLKEPALQAFFMDDVEHGLHKAATSKTFTEEAQKLQTPVKANRNHYLRISLPGHYEALDEAGFLFDSSLGFSEKSGFRNSYGRAFKPFNLKTNKKFGFVEYPLSLMDVTLCNVQFSHLPQAEKYVATFLERYSTHRDIAVLWHNNYFTEGSYVDWFSFYKKILQKAKQLSLTPVTPSQVIERFKDF